MSRGSDEWCAAQLTEALAAAARGDGLAVAAIAMDLRQLGLANPSDALLSAWTQLLTPLFYVAKRRDIADKMIGELEAFALRQGDQASRGTTWRAQLAYARARRALVNGDQLESALLFEEVVQRFDECGDGNNACLYRISAGFSYNVIGAFARARELLEQAIVLAQSLALPRAVANAKSNLGISLARLGLFAEAEQVEREAIAYFSDHEDQYYRDAATLYLGFIFQDAGRWDDVASLMQPLTAPTVASDIRLCALTSFARYWLTRADAKTAFPLAREALTLLAELGEVEEGEEAARLIFAKAAIATGDNKAATGVLRTARARLLSKAARTSKLALRDAFLTQLPDNVELLALAKAMLSG